MEKAYTDTHNRRVPVKRHSEAGERDKTRSTRVDQNAEAVQAAIWEAFSVG